MNHKYFFGRYGQSRQKLSQGENSHDNGHFAEKIRKIDSPVYVVHQFRSTQSTYSGSGRKTMLNCCLLVLSLIQTMVLYISICELGTHKVTMISRMFLKSLLKLLILTTNLNL